MKKKSLNTELRMTVIICMIGCMLTLGGCKEKESLFPEESNQNVQVGVELPTVAPVTPVPATPVPQHLHLRQHRLPYQPV